MCSISQGALEEADFDEKSKTQLYHHISYRYIYIYMCTLNVCMYYTYELISRYSEPGDLTSNLSFTVSLKLVQTWSDTPLFGQ